MEEKNNFNKQNTEKEERNLQASKMVNDTKAKTDIVNSILDELEREINDEN